MDDSNANIGRIATSKAGRDSGRNFIIVGICDEQYVLVADGEMRKLAKPKRKKLRHLIICDAYAETIREKLIEGRLQVFDAEIRKWLRQWEARQNQDCEEE